MLVFVLAESYSALLTVAYSTCPTQAITIVFLVFPAKVGMSQRLFATMIVTVRRTNLHISLLLQSTAWNDSSAGGATEGSVGSRTGRRLL